MTVQEKDGKRESAGALELGLAADLLPSDQLSYMLGRSLGRQVFWFVVGAPLLAFTGGGFAVAGSLLIAGGLLFFGAGIVTVRLMRYGRPYRGWRLAGAACVAAAAPVAWLWPGGPVQRLTGTALPGWTAAVALLLALFVVDRRNRGAAVFRFEPPVRNSLAWLDARISYQESLLRARRVLPPERRDVLRALGFARMLRFEDPAGGQIADLHRAVDLFRQVMAVLPPGGRDELGAYHDLAGVLAQRAMLEMRGADIEEALALLHGITSSALSARLPESERDWVERLTFELTWLRLFAHRQLQLPGPDDSARDELVRQITAAASRPRPDFAQARILVTLAEVHLLWTYPQTRGNLVGTAEMTGHLDRAIDAVRAAEALMTEDHRDKSYAQSMLAHLLARRVRVSALGMVPADRAEADHAESVRFFRLAVAHPDVARLQPVAEVSGGLSKVLDTASLCVDVELSQGRWDQAAEIGRLGLGLLETIVASASSRDKREEALRVGRGLHARLAYALTMAGPGGPSATVEVVRLIEAGRAVLLSEALGRAELAGHAARLRAAGHAALADEITAALARVGELEAIELSAHDAEGRAVRQSVDEAGQPLRDSIRQAHAGVARLRARAESLLGGGGDQDAARDLAAAAAAAPLCYLLHVSTGDDGAGPDLPAIAVLVTSSPPLAGPPLTGPPPAGPPLAGPPLAGPPLAGPPPAGPPLAEPPLTVRAVPLLAVTGAVIAGWYRQWAAAYVGGELSSAALDALAELFRELGAKMIQPAFAAAGAPARLVLLPDGLLSMLPLHVAAVEREAGAALPLCRQAVVSYAPSAAILRACQAKAASIDAPGAGRLPARFVGIAARDADLRGASPELRSAAAHFPVAEIIGDGAGPVLAALAANARGGVPSVLHFACHARAEVTDPLSSFFQLAPEPGGQVRLADLLAGGLGSSRLAVLSACETGIPGSSDPDQYVSLATGFVQVGAAGVIGTMTRVADPVAVALTGHFYDAWVKSPEDPARALAAAQRWLATADPAAVAQLLADAYPDLPPLDVWQLARQLAHPAYWAPFFFLGA